MLSKIKNLFKKQSRKDKISELITVSRLGEVMNYVFIAMQGTLTETNIDKKKAAEARFICIMEETVGNSLTNREIDLLLSFYKNKEIQVAFEKINTLNPFLIQELDSIMESVAGTKEPVKEQSRIDKTLN